VPTHLPAHLATHFGPMRASGGQWLTQCRAHDDRTPSLAIRVIDDKVLVNCHAGCTLQDVLAAHELMAADLFLEERKPAVERLWDGMEVEETYDYRDEDGALLFQVVRCKGKRFLQRRPDHTSKTGWRYNLDSVRRVPYRLPRILDAMREGKEILIVEGEADVHAAEAAGRVATCNPGGAGKWRPEYNHYFKDASILLVGDNDEPGKEHVRQLALHLGSVAREVRIAEVADVEGVKDLRDHLGKGLSWHDLRYVTGPSTDVSELSPLTLRDLLATDTSYDWVIPGLLERMDRMLLVGLEGGGKSLLLNQIAFASALGLHPFEHRDIGYRARVVVVDLENSRRMLARRMHMFVQAAQSSGIVDPVHIAEEQLSFYSQPTGLDLTREQDAEWLMSRVALKPCDILVIGPWYRLHAKNPNDEEVARRVVRVIDQIRVLAQCAVVIESHAGHGESITKREMRPTGSSLQLRWPEFGIGMIPQYSDIDGKFTGVVKISHWRGARDERQWPDELERGNRFHPDPSLYKGWPWVVPMPGTWT